MYVNYELLCNALSTNLIDFSQAEIYDLNNESMTKKQFEEFLSIQNEYIEEKFALRSWQMRNMELIGNEITRKDTQKEKDQAFLLER